MTKLFAPTFTIALACAYLLAGCANAPAKALKSKTAGDEPDPLVELLQVAKEAMEERKVAGRTRDTIALSQASPAALKQRREQANYVPKGFEVVRSFHYTGPAAQMVSAMALMAGYKPLPTLGEDNFGGTPAQRADLHIDVVQQPLVEVLHQVSAALGDAGVVELDERSRTIRLRWLSLQK